MFGHNGALSAGNLERLIELEESSKDYRETPGYLSHTLDKEAVLCSTTLTPHFLPTFAEEVLLFWFKEKSLRHTFRSVFIALKCWAELCLTSWT